MVAPSPVLSQMPPAYSSSSAPSSCPAPIVFLPYHPEPCLLEVEQEVCISHFFLVASLHGSRDPSRAGVSLRWQFFPGPGAQHGPGQRRAEHVSAESRPKPLDLGTRGLLRPLASPPPHRARRFQRASRSRAGRRASNPAGRRALHRSRPSEQTKLTCSQLGGCAGRAGTASIGADTPALGPAEPRAGRDRRLPCRSLTELERRRGKELGKRV